MENETTTLKDYEQAAAVDLKNLFKTTGIVVGRTDPQFTTKPWNAGEKPWPHFAYMYTFSKNGENLAMPYSCGADKDEGYNKRPKADKLPKAEEVFGRICEEALTAHTTSFEEWAQEFGYDTDSRRDEKIYNTCEQSYFNLIKLVTVKEMERFAELVCQL
jgi:hypothetical protein